MRIRRRGWRETFPRQGQAPEALASCGWRRLQHFSTCEAVQVRLDDCGVDPREQVALEQGQGGDRVDLAGQPAFTVADLTGDSGELV